MRSIPSIEQLRQRPAMRRLEAEYGHAALVDALRAEAGVLRAAIAAGGPLDGVPESGEAEVPESGEAEVPGSIEAAGRIEAGVASRLLAESAPSLRRVINATGVIVHTNLGRAPLCRPAVERLAALGAGYTNLEYDLHAGRRGRRDVHAARLICRLTGADAAVVVNNNAAATLLVLAALAAGREAIISRGELVEIGGGFRIPDVMTQSGVTLREVGTTNRTRAADYAAAISERTALILRVHPSNFRISGFTERPSLPELVALGRRFNVPVVEDLGSGWLGQPPASSALRDEPMVPTSLAEGADLVLFSGDKLLGGPQAGIIAGRAAASALVAAHPLMRALRVDKLTYAALEATLQEYAAGRAARTVPVARMIGMSRDDVGVRADALAERLSGSGLPAEVIDGDSTIGGGSAPESALPTRLVRLLHPALNAADLEARLRRHDPPIIARIQDDCVVLDLRTVDPEEDELLARFFSP